MNGHVDLLRIEKYNDHGMKGNQAVGDKSAKLTLPPLKELGDDLVLISPLQRALALAAPFACVIAYILFSKLALWPAAVVSVMYLSFVTYGSTSHDLVHHNLGLPRRLNDFLLSLIELLTLRSGHAYRLAHLHHHAEFPHDDDIEARAAKLSFMGALLEGVTLQQRIWLWAAFHAKRNRAWIVGEGLASLAIAGIAVAVYHVTPAPLIYAALVIMGSWIFPLITVFIPHNPNAQEPLLQTRLFRGRMMSLIAMEHLYHLEHHLYPQVPHQNWPKLARRLDPYFAKQGIVPIKLWF